MNYRETEETQWLFVPAGPEIQYNIGKSRKYSTGPKQKIQADANAENTIGLHGESPHGGGRRPPYIVRPASTFSILPSFVFLAFASACVSCLCPILYVMFVSSCFCCFCRAFDEVPCSFYNRTKRLYIIWELLASKRVRNTLGRLIKSLPTRQSHSANFSNLGTY